MPRNKKSRKWMNRKKKAAHPYKLWICKELMYEWESGNVTADQVLFLAKIDSFIEWLHYCSRIGKLGSTIKKYLHKKHGVWMTDQELGTRQGVSKNV